MRKTILLLLLLTSCNTPVTKVENNNQQHRLQLVGAASVVIKEELVKTPDSVEKKNIGIINDAITTLGDTPTQDEIMLFREAIYNDIDELNVVLSDVIIEKREIEERYRTENATLSTELANAKRRQGEMEEELEQFDSAFFSLKHGVNIIIKRVAWSVGIFSALFLLLRIFAGSNPIAGAVFSIFSHMGAAVVRGIASIFPQLWQHVSMVRKDVAEAKENVLTKLVDEIGVLRDDPGIEKLKDALSKRMNDEDKNIITDIKKKLGW